MTDIREIAAPGQRWNRSGVFLGEAQSNTEFEQVFESSFTLDGSVPMP